jgi:multidrug resistance efflux pump
VLDASSGFKGTQSELYNMRCSRCSSIGRTSRGSDSSNAEAEVETLQKQHAELRAKLAGEEALLQQLEADLFEARGNAAAQKRLLQLVWAKQAAAAQQQQEVKEQQQQKKRSQKHWWQCKATQQKNALRAGKAESAQLQGQTQQLQTDLLKLNRQVRTNVWASQWLNI